MHDDKATVQTKDFAGSQCQDASRFIEQALGLHEQLTAELHLSASHQTENRQRA